MTTSEPDFARSLDAADPLAIYRKQFIIPKRDGMELVYFLGNSLGLQPGNTRTAIDAVLEQWAHYGVEGFFQGEQPWMNLHDRLTGPLSSIVGALPHEVVVMNQLSVNLHLMLVSFYRPHGKRNKIICEAKAFPSDQYVLETHIKHLGLDPQEVIVEVKPRPGSYIIDEDDVLEVIEKHHDDVALVLWGGVNYYTGQLFNIRNITAAAHRAGAIAGFDLAHAAGNVPLELHNWDVDFACWCSYKYLNSGPGAVAGTFVHERYHTDSDIKRFGGWWGYNKAKRFKMEPGFDPVQSAEGWQLSTPAMLLYASHLAALEVFEAAGVDAIFAKSAKLSAYLYDELADISRAVGTRKLQLLTPPAASARGSQVSMLVQTNGRHVFEQLASNGIYADWREPDVIRVAPVPLYNSYEEVARFCSLLRQILL